jgi:murein DD-endopeptidase MepM/ murein hydrolase activator NlpD
LALVAGAIGGTGTAGAQTPGLDAARAAAQQAAQDYADAQTALGVLDQELEALEADQADAEAELAALEDDLAEAVVEQYMDAGLRSPLVPSGDLSDQAEADALFRLVNQHDRDVIDQYLSAAARRDEARAAIETRLADQQQLLDELEASQARLEAELATLEQLERERVAEERRRAEAAARESAEAAAAAERLADQEAAADAGDQITDDTNDDEPASPAGPTTTDAPEPEPGTPTDPVTPPPTGGGMICPVPGSAFVDSFGDPRPQGWAHQGVDMMAPSGTPIVAPVSGTVAHRGNAVGGLAFHLNGSDGRYYYGAHLSGYGQSGQVAAGTVIGYVGNTGDAAATAPHLHLEIHIGGVAVNPYPYVAAVC